MRGLKLVVGIVRPERLEAVKEALGEAKVFRLTVSDVQGFEAGEKDTSAATAEPPVSRAAAAYAGAAASSVPRLARKVKLEIAVNENFVEPTVRAIARAARLDGGRPGDGKVLVLPLEECIRIRTGERGPEAI
jgi:nitrogen regulatory protein P-II 1